jgi:hypothetical protein
VRTAALLASVLVTAACGAVGPTASGGNSSSSADGGWYQQATASPAVEPSPISNPLANPVGSPTPGPSPAPVAAATPAPSCYPVRGGTASHATITDIRVGTHPGYDRVVVQFSGGLPAYQLMPKDPAGFVAPGSGNPVAVVGRAGVDLTLTGMDIPAGFQAVNLKPSYPELKNVLVLGVYEGQADVAIGLDALKCPVISTLSGPRLVIDFPTG